MPRGRRLTLWQSLTVSSLSQGSRAGHGCRRPARAVTVVVGTVTVRTPQAATEFWPLEMAKRMQMCEVENETVVQCASATVASAAITIRSRSGGIIGRAGPVS
jgi:hypothetical protein